MRLVELNLLAFGPFTERRLVFASDGEQAGLQIVYGSNEAGKSSALRGLRALLYGIDARSTDDFVHIHKNMRVAGCLQNAAGERLEFVRRKGNKDTLLNAAGDTPLGEMALAPFLQTVTADMFSSLFGIDHPALLRGGEEILEQKGELGRALFSAALGSHDLNAVLKGLDEEADLLFKPQGYKQQITAAISEFNACKRELREQSLKPGQWQKHSDALQKTRQALQHVQAELDGKRRELSRLQRIQRLQPRFANHRQLLTERAALDGVVVLSEDFSQRRTAAVADQARASAVLQAAQPRIKALRDELAALRVDQNLLAQAQDISELRDRIGTEAKAQQDRLGLVIDRQALLDEASRLLRELRPDISLGENPPAELPQLEPLRPLLSKRRHLSETGAQQRVVVAALRQAQQARRDAAARLGELQAISAADSDQALPDPQALDVLRRALAAARKEGDIDGRLRDAIAKRSALQQQCDAATGRLGLASLAVETLPALAMPNRETINRFEQAYSAWQQQQQGLQQEQQQLKGKLQDAQRDRDAMQRAAAVPSEADLQQQRQQREQLWGQLRSGWLDGDRPAGNQLASAGPLADDFEQHSASADELADRLRREADRVQKLALLDAEHASLKQRLQDKAGQQQAAASQREQLDSDWQAQWQNGPPSVSSPAEMRIWLEAFERLREQLLQLAQQASSIDSQQQTRARHSDAVRQALAALGPSADGLAKPASGSGELQPLLADSEALLRRLDQQRQQQQQAQRDRHSLQQRLAECDAALEQAQQDEQAWRQQWRALLDEVGLDADSTPADADSFIDSLQQLFAKQHDIAELQRRIDGIDRDASAFAAQVSELATRIAPDLSESSPAEAARELSQRLQQSRSAHEQQQRLQKQLDAENKAVAQARLEAATAQQVLAALADEAGCEHSDSALLDAERQSADKARVQAALATLEQQINEDSAGMPLAALQAEVSAVDADALPADIAALNAVIETELEPRQTALAETAGGQQKELEQMDGSGAAAELAEQAQQTLAGIRADAERYVQLKLAARILRDQIERYRQQNQGPLVQRASEHFAALTLGSFERLSIDFNDKDQAVLAGVRPQGDAVQVQGMSAGTRDQLYLALRLASLEKYIHSAEPMPFIVDDVLVDFDDQRSAAALQTLAELAENTQVILFTHHARLVEQARQLDPAAHIHTL